MTHRPDEDSSTKRRRVVVRSGCGFFIGACAALATMTHHVREDYYPLLWIGASGTLCAYLAAKHGDRFWAWFGRTGF